MKIVGADGTTGVSGMPVNLDENSSLNDTTDANGCVQFGFLKGTDYHVSFSKAGYVDADGNNAVTSSPITVVPGSSGLTPFQYDRAGALTASFRDQTGAADTAYGAGLTLFNTALSGNQERSFSNGTSLNDS